MRIPRRLALVLFVTMLTSGLHPFVAAQELPLATTTSTTTTSSTTTTTASTTTTTTVPSGGGLAISVPESAGAAAPVASGAGAVSIAMGQVTVTDTRAIDVLNPTRGWEATVSLSQPFAALAPASFAIPAANVAYLSGIGTGVGLGVGTLTPGQDGVTQGPQTLETSRRAMLASGVSLSGSVVTWNPTISVTIPAGAPAGDYAGTITHSVS